MAVRPNVTVSIVDNSFIVSDTEDSGSHVSAMYSYYGVSGENLVSVFGVTAEKDNKHMILSV